MARLRRLLPPVLIPLAVLAVVCGAAHLLPFRMIEPDDDDYFYGMHAFARGKVVMTEDELEQLREVPIPDETKSGSGPHHARGRLRAMAVRSPKGFVRERSPGHYALLALFHRFGWERLTNFALAFVCLGVFYYVARCHLELAAGTAVLASLLLIVNPTFLTMLYRVYMSDFDYFVWATVSLGLYFAARRTGRWWMCAAAGLSLSISVLFRHTNAISFVVIGAYEVLRYWLRLRELAYARRDGSTAMHEEPFGWGRTALLAGFVLLGLVPLAWYGYATTGQLFGTGYQSRLGRQEYFALWDSGAVFSFRHLLLGEHRGMMCHGYNLSVGLARLLQGYPLLLLAPAGLLMMGRKRGRPALLLFLWVLFYWGIYLCYGTIRADSFQFMCRKLSPALAPLAVGAAVALAGMSRKARWTTFAVLTVLSLGVTSQFFVQFLSERRGGPRRPGGARRGAALDAPPHELLRFASDRLADEPAAAARALRSLAGFLADMPRHAPTDVRRAAEELLPHVKRLDDALREALKAQGRLPKAKVESFRKTLRELDKRLRDVLPPRGGRRGPQFREQFGPPEGPRGRRGPAPDDDPARLVGRLHELMDEARRQGIDVSEAERLDEASKRAAERGDWEGNRRALREALEAAERALRRGDRRKNRRGEEL